jgi:hypothetical protein
VYDTAVRVAIVVAIVWMTAVAGADDDVYKRLRDTGPIPGLPGFARMATQSQRRCGKLAITVVRTGLPVKAEDRPFAALLAFDVPSDIDVSLSRAADNKFLEWLVSLGDAVKRAEAFYEHRTTNEDSPGHLVDLARIAQIRLHAASLIARLEVPAGQCRQLAGFVEQIIQSAEDVAKQCAEKARALPPGWWNLVCK